MRIYDSKVTVHDGIEVSLADYKGKVLLIKTPGLKSGISLFLRGARLLAPAQEGNQQCFEKNLH